MDLRTLVITRLEQLGLGAVEAATAVGIERTFVRDIVDGKKKSVRQDKMATLARALRVQVEGLARGEIIPDDQPLPSSHPKPNASFPPRYQKFSSDESVPLLGQTVGGPNGRFVLNGAEIGRVFCPPMLEGVEGAYAVRVHGTSMEPRYKAGETVWLNPQEPVRAGDDVVAQILQEGDDQPVESYIKEFRSRSSKVLRLFQHNPEEGESKEIEFENERVFSVHKIVFHANV